MFISRTWPSAVAVVVAANVAVAAVVAVSAGFTVGKVTSAGSMFMSGLPLAAPASLDVDVLCWLVDFASAC